MGIVGSDGHLNTSNYMTLDKLFSFQMDQIVLSLYLIGILGTTQSGLNPQNPSSKLSGVLSSNLLIYIPIPSHSCRTPPQSIGEPPFLCSVVILKLLDIAVSDCQPARDVYCGTKGYRKVSFRHY